MGNSQSATEKEAGAGEDPRLRRFHTGASDAATGPNTKQSPSPTPPLRRTSTTATSSAAENRTASLGRAGSSALSRGVSTLDGTASLGRKSGSVSAAGSPRASEKERAWVRSATRRSSTMSSGESTTSPVRGRSRSGSIGNLLTGGGGSRGSRGATLHEDQVFDPQSDDRSTSSRRAELTYRRKKSIDLTDVVDSAPAAGEGRVQSMGRIGKRSTNRSPASIISPVQAGPDARQQESGQTNADADDTTDVAGSTDVYNPLFPDVTKRTNKDALGRSQPAAFPSYLKIPTLIPSTYASPTSSGPSSPSLSEVKGWPAEEGQPSGSLASAFPAKIGGGGTAAAAILNTEDIVIKPGGASKASTPTEEHTPGHTPGRSDETLAEAVSIEGKSQAAGDESTEGEAIGVPSRTPTPTPGNLQGARAMTPTGQQGAAMSAISPALSTASTAHEHDVGGPQKRGSLQMYTGMESGQNTPGLVPLPIGLTSAPSSALTPEAISTYDANVSSKDVSLPTYAGPSAPLSKATNDLRLTLPPALSSDKAAHPSLSSARTSSVTPTRQTASQVPLMPITVRWRGGGKEVFVTGTFANEWRSKILLKRTAGSGKKAEYSCVLHLAPGTHRLKFIVDDRWRVSRDLSTASDGEGNLTNYIEVAHMGPAHPGPLSAPGEDLLVPEDDEEKRKKKATEPGLSAHKATMDLMEEARRAEALRRGDLLEVFGDDKVRKQDKWTQEIPESIIKAQAAEEAHRNELEMQAESAAGSKHSKRDSMHSSSGVPAPPTLPRQLEKVILNSSPAAVAGAVDDNSVLPAPNHAVLHHLTASAIKSGVIATGCTMRYRKKYITTIYYRAAN